MIGVRKRSGQREEKAAKQGVLNDSYSMVLWMGVQRRSWAISLGDPRAWRKRIAKCRRTR